jgi:5-methylcytosine-specific restriction endonuclease McrA
MGAKRSRVKLPPDEYDKLRTAVMYRDNKRCKVCKSRNNLHAHHIVFRSQGGDDCSFNLLTVCNDCHEAIHDRYVIILPLNEDQPINADEGVKIFRVNNWKPKYIARGF